MKNPAKVPLAFRSRFLLEQASGGRVDREAGIIYGVKILGPNSINKRLYLPPARRDAVRFYEGRSVNADHPDKPTTQRSVRDRCAWLENVYEEGDSVYGDLHVLMSHPIAGPLFEAAEKNPRLFGLSHNAVGEGYMKNGIFHVERITGVRHVDLVADAATTQSLFEGRDMAQAHLLEDDLLSPPAVSPDPAATEPGGSGDWKSQLAALASSVVAGDETPEQVKAKLMHIVKMLQLDTGSAEPLHEDGDDDSMNMPMESRRGRKPQGREVELQEENRRLKVELKCHKRGVACTEQLLESLMPLPSKSQDFLLEQIGATRPAGGRQAQSVPYGGRVGQAQTGGVPKGEAFLKALRG